MSSGEYLSFEGKVDREVMRQGYFQDFKPELTEA